ncbi:hypothetical protein [Actinoalloteichus hymeniacidonis]|uniref:Peptidase MA superfamily n=1 Tax=Actinoalloteichus hymeniacidonis TaxID=340345 RepID=A0AAC9N0Q6_9PSEU|nr:hypothetical protein [Actinoalloteichus hymeniacidonis]AOS65131.1 Peptidase MA superfamily [Actinoalloteichus hymeniacidonis]MBB5906790.1 hypothetical protein [Actinoalloteichus hymeniacidonis]
MSRSRSWATAAITAALLTGLAVIALPGPGQTVDTDRHGAPAPAPPAFSGFPTAALPDARAGSGEPAGMSAEDEAVAELLDRRAEAVLNRDEQAFLSTLDPAADPAFRRSQRETFANLAEVPLAEWDYRIVRPAASMPEPPANLAIDAFAATEADGLAAPEVELRYALAGVDEASTGKPMAYLFVRRDDRWFVNSDTSLEAQGRHTWRGPWAFGPTVVHRRASGLVLGHPENAELTRRVADELDAAVRSVSEIWGTDWSQQTVVLLPGSTAEFQAQAGLVFSPDDIAALAVADSVDLDTQTATGQRIVVNPASAARLSDPALGVVLRHEVTHVAARGVTASRAPMWLLEGFADYVGYRDSGFAAAQIAPDLSQALRDRRLGAQIDPAPSGDPTGVPIAPPGSDRVGDESTEESPTPLALPADGEFHEGGNRLDLAYQTSWSLIDFLADGYGESSVVDFYRRLAAANEPTEVEVDRAMRAVFGTGRTVLLDRWRRAVERELG